MLLDTISSFYQKHKKNFFFTGFFIILFFVLGEGVFAANEGEFVSKEKSDAFIKILNGALTAVAAILSIMTSLVSMLLYPGWVNGTLFDLQDYFREIWILISNVVYFIFAGILIVIAFMNIIGKGEGNWELKQAMPKFIVGVLIVPFSWFFVQFILSITAIFTVGVLTLPYDVFQDKPLYNEALDKTELGEVQVCKDLLISFGSGDGKGITGTSISSNAAIDESIRCQDGGLVSIRDVLNGTGGGDGLNNSIFGVISVYSYGILRVQELDTIDKVNLTTIKGVTDLLFKIVFDLLFVMVYFLLMIALFLALFVRGIRLWIYMMLSPAFGLLYFFGKGSEGVGSDNAKFSIKEFISLALIPVYVSAALAFGLVFILVASEGIQDTASSTDKDTLSIGGFSLTILGAHGDGKEERSVVGKLIIEIFGIVILWIAVMAALRSSETTKAVVEPIAAFGKSVGELAAKAPTYAPIIPAGGGGVSAQGLRKIGTMPQSALEQRVGNNVGRHQQFFNKTFGAEGVDAGAQTRIRNAMRDGILGTELPQVQKQLRDLIDKHGTDNSTVRELTQDFAKSLQGSELGISGSITDDHIKDLFKGGKLSNPGYGILHNDGLTAVTSGYSIDKSESYASTKRRPDTPTSGTDTNTKAVEKKFDDLVGDYKKVEKTDGLTVKVKRENSGVIEVVSKKVDGGSESSKFTIDTTTLTAKSFNGNDIDEAKKLHGDLRNDNDFEDVLKAAGFKNTEDLLKQVKGDETDTSTSDAGTDGAGGGDSDD